jgi:hypothetical protein
MLYLYGSVGPADEECAIPKPEEQRPI